MKKISLWATMLALLVCGLCVTSCSKDDEEKDGGGKNGGKKEQKNDLNDYFDYGSYRCERVGANLIIELMFNNKMNKAFNNAQLALTDRTITDNLGNKYYLNGAVFLANSTDINAWSNYKDNWQSLNIPAEGYAIYAIKILNFDPTNKAAKISFNLEFSASGLSGDHYVLSAEIPIDDYRVMEKGIQTNDTALTYKITNCERVGTVLQIDYTITNNSDIELGNLTFLPIDYAKDDLGNSYYCRGNIDITFNDGLYKRDANFVLRLKPSETANGRIRIRDFDSKNKAKNISFPLQCSSNVYALSDNVVRFLTIPIKDNRIIYDGIQTPDLKIDVELIGTEIDEDGNLIVNYSIQNNTGETLSNFTVDGGMMWITDNLSNKYYSRDKMAISINNSDYVRDAAVQTTIPAGASIPASVAIIGFDSKASNTTFNLEVSCKNYEFADNLIHFITIPVQR